MNFSQKERYGVSFFWWMSPLIYALSFLILAGILAPLFFWLVEPFSSHPFRRYTDRALMIAALLCLIPYLRGHWRVLGLQWESLSGRHFFWGVAWGVLSILLLLMAEIGLGFKVIDIRLSVGSFFSIGLAAILVAPLEEILFRGVMQSVLIARMGWRLGLGVTVFLFALLHFFKAPSDFQPDPVTLYSGYQAVGLAFERLAQQALMSNPRFWMLILVGWILGGLYLRTQRLWLPIGLHAGWIIGIQLSSKCTEMVYYEWHRDSYFFYFLRESLPLLILSGFGLVLWRFPKGKLLALPCKDPLERSPLPR